MAWLKPIGVGLVSLGVASFVLGQFPGHQPGIESHYHYRMGEKIAGGDLRPNPGDHLPLSVLAEEHPVDHHFGFHLMIAPFTWYGDIIDDHEIAMKLATMLFVVLAALALFWLLVQVNAPHPEIMCLLPMAFGMVFWRNIQLRGGTLMSVGLIAVIYLAFIKQRGRWAILAAYLLMLCYHGAFLSLPVVGGAAVGVFLWNGAFRGHWDRGTLKPIFWVASGLLLALVVSPYGVNAFEFLIYHLNTAFGDPQGYYQTNHEFSSFSYAMLVHFFEYSLILLGLLSFGSWLWQNRVIAPLHLVALFFACSALVFLTWRSHRLVEYSVPMFIFAYGAFLGQLQGKERQNYLRKSVGLGLGLVLLSLLSGDLEWALWSRMLFLVGVGLLILPIILRRIGRWANVAAALVFLVSGTYGNLSETIANAEQRGTPSDLYAGARPTFERYPGVIGNLFQADFSLILWEHPEARCLQGLNHYFMDKDPALAKAIRRLKQKKKYDPARDDAELEAALQVLWKNGVRLITARPLYSTAFPRPWVHFADGHEEWLTLLWNHPEDRSRIWRLHPPPAKIP